MEAPEEHEDIPRSMSGTADQIREAREQKGLTLAQVEEATRIPLYYLEILEGTGNERLVSDRLYMVHFLRSYAAFLDLQVDPLEVDFLRENRRRAAALQAPEQDARSRKPVLLAVTAAVLAMAGVGVYLNNSTLLDFRPATVEEPAPPSTPADQPLTQPFPTLDPPGTEDAAADSVLQPEANETSPAEPRLVAAPEPEPEPEQESKPEPERELEPEPEPVAAAPETTAPSQDAPASTAATDAPTPRPEDEATSSGADEPQPAAADRGGEATEPPDTAPVLAAAAPDTPETEIPETETQEAPSTDSPDAQSLTIVAHEQSWLRIRADDERSRDMLLDPGQVATLSARTGFVITFGNAGGVSLRFNGEELPPVGRSGQVVRNFRLPPPE